MASRKPELTEGKPFLKGMPTDENTVRQALKFFFMLLLVSVMTFIVCSIASFKTLWLRILVNTLIELVVLFIMYSKGTELGTEAVGRGEILYQHVEKGVEASASERRIPFHPLKGFIIGICGSLLLLIPAVLLAFTAEVQMTGAGTLPSWMEAFMRRTEISDALVQYSQSSAISFSDILRIIVRLLIMPFVSATGSEYRSVLLLLERISPLLVLLPAFAYGCGYLRGPLERRRVHSEIAENKRRKSSREKRERKARREIVPKGPQQLN